MGADDQVIVDPKLMKTQTVNYLFDNNGNVSGWDLLQDWQVEIKNTRDVDITLEYTRDMTSNYWSIENKGDFGQYKKLDERRGRYTITVPARSKINFSYTLKSQYGTRR